MHTTGSCSFPGIAMQSSPEPVLGLLTWDFAKPKGGMGHAMQSMPTALSHGGFDVRVFAPCPDAFPADPFLRFTKRFGGHLLFSALLPFILHRRIREEAITHLFLPVGPGGVFLLYRPKIPVIAIVYHTYAQQSRLVPGQRWKQFFVPLEHRTLRCADMILCFCEDTKNVLIDHYHISPDRIRLLPHGIDIPFWSVPKEKRRGMVVCVARLEARKGVDVLLKAWKRVIEQLPEARLTIIGKGRLPSHAQSVDHRLHCSQAELCACVGLSEIAICPSYLEGFGLACAEAMAAGTAVIASDTDGLRSLIHHERTGLLVKPGDEKQFAEAIIRLLRDDDLRRSLAGAAQAEACVRFDPSSAERELVNVVRSLVG